MANKVTFYIDKIKLKVKQLYCTVDDMGSNLL